MTRETTDPTKPNDKSIPRTRDAALALAAAGYRIMPLHIARKEPVFDDWPRVATSDKRRVNAWWTMWPRANVGIVTGAGLVVIDVDGPEGEATLARLQSEHGRLPDTRTALTSKGRHLYFGSSVPTSNSVSRIGAGVDVRGDRGFVVAPPSLHPSGAEYRWDDDGPTADLPATWVALLQSPVDEPFVPVANSDVPFGAQGDYLFKRACSRRAHGWNFEGILAEMVNNPPVNQPGREPWAQHDFVSIARSACNYEPGEMPGTITRGTSPTPATPPSTSWRVNAQELMDSEEPDVECLTVFGREGIIVQGWAHLMSGQAKVGKSTLMRHLVRDWLDTGMKVLWYTEDPQSAWRTLLRRDGGDWSGLTLVYAGIPEPEARAMAASCEEQVVIVDTVRAFIPCEDENNASQRAASVRPWVNEVAHAAGKTLILSVHARKSGGQHGEGIAGSHELLAAADTAIEVNWPGADPLDKKRKLTTLGRVFEPVSMIYESTDDGLRDVGDSGSIERHDLEQAILQLLKPGRWDTTTAIGDTLEIETSGRKQLIRTLTRLATFDRIRRDPPINETAERRTVKWTGR